MILKFVDLKIGGGIGTWSPVSLSGRCSQCLHYVGMKDLQVHDEFTIDDFLVLKLRKWNIHATRVFFSSGREYILLGAYSADTPVRLQQARFDCREFPIKAERYHVLLITRKTMECYSHVWLFFIY